MPVGPSILWPVNTTMSAPSAVRSTGICGTACAASTTTIAPTACARSMIAASGLTEPSMFEIHVTVTIRVRALISSSRFDRSRRPSSVAPNHRNVAPVRCASSCHGTMLEWCSISVVTISSPGRISRSPTALRKVLATRLSASLAFFVNTISSRDGALTNAATLSRAPSKAAVASAPSWCMARATLALCQA